MRFRITFDPIDLTDEWVRGRFTDPRAYPTSPELSGDIVVECDKETLVPFEAIVDFFEGLAMSFHECLSEGKAQFLSLDGVAKWTLSIDQNILSILGRDIDCQVGLIEFTQAVIDALHATYSAVIEMGVPFHDLDDYRHARARLEESQRVWHYDPVSVLVDYARWLQERR